MLLESKKETVKTKSILTKFLQKRNQTKKTMVYNVVGVTFEGRQKTIQKYYKQLCENGKRLPCHLILEDDNKFDKNAVAVYICGEDKLQQIGYISKDQNSFIRQFFENIFDIKINDICFFQGIYSVKINIVFQE